MSAPLVQAADHPENLVVHYRPVSVEGVDIFYREAGPVDAPVVLLLHGFPTSSFMFRNLIPLLATRYHVIAPDYPGFGQRDIKHLDFHLLDTGHFALEDSTPEIAKRMLAFLDQSTAR